MTLEESKLHELNRFAKQIRLNTLECLNHLGFGHYGGSLSVVEALAVLYGEIMPMTPDKFKETDRDYFVLSKGHAGPALYSTLYLKGFFDKEFLFSLNTNGTHLPSHPDRNLTPGVDMTTGSLGQGFSAACGMALAAKMDHADWRVYTILGDGELEEGQIWEAAMYAAHYKLDHLTAFIDNNGLQIDGAITDVMSSLPIDKKFSAFGWHVITVNGHNMAELHNAIEEARNIKGKPTMIIMKTVKGKGIPEIEGKASWHGKAPSSEECERFVKMLEAE